MKHYRSIHIKHKSLANCITCENVTCYIVSNACTYIEVLTSTANYWGLHNPCFIVAVYICLYICLYVSVVCILKDDHHTLQLRAHRHHSLYCKFTYRLYNEDEGLSNIHDRGRSPRTRIFDDPESELYSWLVPECGGVSASY